MTLKARYIKASKERDWGIVTICSGPLIQIYNHKPVSSTPFFDIIFECKEADEILDIDMKLCVTESYVMIVVLFYSGNMRVDRFNLDSHEMTKTVILTTDDVFFGGAACFLSENSVDCRFLAVIGRSKYYVNPATEQQAVTSCQELATLLPRDTNLRTYQLRGQEMLELFPVSTSKNYAVGKLKNEYGHIVLQWLEVSSEEDIAECIVLWEMHLDATEISLISDPHKERIILTYGEEIKVFGISGQLLSIALSNLELNDNITSITSLCPVPSKNSDVLKFTDSDDEEENGTTDYFILSFRSGRYVSIDISNEDSFSEGNLNPYSLSPGSSSLFIPCCKSMIILQSLELTDVNIHYQVLGLHPCFGVQIFYLSSTSCIDVLSKFQSNPIDRLENVKSPLVVDENGYHGPRIVCWNTMCDLSEAGSVVSLEEKPLNMIHSCSVVRELAHSVKFDTDVSQNGIELGNAQLLCGKEFENKTIVIATSRLRNISTLLLLDRTDDQSVSLLNPIADDEIGTGPIQDEQSIALGSIDDSFIVQATTKHILIIEVKSWRRISSTLEGEEFTHGLLPIDKLMIGSDNHNAVYLVDFVFQRNAEKECIVVISNRGLIRAYKLSLSPSKRLVNVKRCGEMQNRSDISAHCGFRMPENGTTGSSLWMAFSFWGDTSKVMFVSFDFVSKASEQRNFTLSLPADAELSPSVIRNLLIYPSTKSDSDLTVVYSRGIDVGIITFSLNSYDIFTSVSIFHIPGGVKRFLPSYSRNASIFVESETSSFLLSPTESPTIERIEVFRKEPVFEDYKESTVILCNTLSAKQNIEILTFRSGYGESGIQHFFVYSSLGNVKTKILASRYLEGRIIGIFDNRNKDGTLVTVFELPYIKLSVIILSADSLLGYSCQDIPIPVIESLSAQPDIEKSDEFIDFPPISVLDVFSGFLPTISQSLKNIFCLWIAGRPFVDEAGTIHIPSILSSYCTSKDGASDSKAKALYLDSITLVETRPVVNFDFDLRSNFVGFVLHLESRVSSSIICLSSSFSLTVIYWHEFIEADHANMKFEVVDKFLYTDEAIPISTIAHEIQTEADNSSTCLTIVVSRLDKGISIFSYKHTGLEGREKLQEIFQFPGSFFSDLFMATYFGSFIDVLFINRLNENLYTVRVKTSIFARLLVDKDEENSINILTYCSSASYLLMNRLAKIVRVLPSKSKTIDNPSDFSVVISSAESTFFFIEFIDLSCYYIKDKFLTCLAFSG